MSNLSYMDTVKLQKEVDLFKVLSSKTRLKIVGLLLSSRCDICVKDVAESIEMSHSATSHQLSILENKGVVECCRNGQTMCYKLADSEIASKIRKMMRVVYDSP